MQAAFANVQWDPDAWNHVFSSIAKDEYQQHEKGSAYHLMRLFVQFHTFEILRQGFYRHPDDHKDVPISRVCTRSPRAGPITLRRKP